jgi:hypothetical protein
MTFIVRQVDFFRLDMQTRFPFRYGIATMTEVPHLVVRIDALVDGRACRGLAADGLPPKWFTKNPNTSFEQDDLPAMIESIRHAAGLAMDAAPARSLFDWWWNLYEAQMSWARQDAIPTLLAGFGCSLMERAAIDALCRAQNVTFEAAIRIGLMGIDLARMRPALARCRVADLLPARANRSVILRHTVGLGDPLTPGEISEKERLEDGLPHSLVESIRRYGLHFFKIKLSGDLQQDQQRMSALQQLFDQEVGESMRLTLDGNEQYQSLADFRNAWRTLRCDPAIRSMLDHSLLFVEQPLHRDVALQQSVGDELAAWPDAPPIIIDESDGDMDAFPRAISLGYRGTSHKNCKGIFKSLAAVATIEMARAESGPLILSAEDLGNVGPIALLQDLAVVASLGINHVERNGHHYFAGLSMFPDSIQRSVLTSHGDLYQRASSGFAALAIRDGALDLGSVVEAPFGLKPPLHCDLLESWKI